MGLDAVVYNQLESLPDHVRRSVRSVDSITGELDYVEYIYPFPKDELLAANVRLGNISLIGSLRNYFAAYFPEHESALFNAFLYSGNHCGDSIALADLAITEADLAYVMESEVVLAEHARQFITQVEMLIASARSQSNAIVFI